MAITLESWYHEEVHSVVWFLWCKHILPRPPLKVHHQLADVYDEDAITVNYGRK